MKNQKLIGTIIVILTLIAIAVFVDWVLAPLLLLLFWGANMERG